MTPTEPARETLHHSGLVQGRLDHLLPTIYLHQYEDANSALENNRGLHTPGMFALCPPAFARTPNWHVRTGLLLPLRLCRDSAAREALQAAAAELQKPGATLRQRRENVQALLHQTFQGHVQMPDWESMDGFCELQRSDRLMHLLCTAFDYVTHVADNPQGSARVTGTARFHWQSWDELLHWHQSLGCSKWHQGPLTLTPLLLSQAPTHLDAHREYRWAREFLYVPDVDTAHCQAPAPDATGHTLSLRLEMEEAGWAALHLGLGHAPEDVRLSYLYDPFLTLTAWGREIDEGHLPAGMVIDEEGCTVRLEALPTANPAWVQLRAVRVLWDGRQIVLAKGRVQRHTLAQTLKAELRRFFTEEFKPEEWHLGSYGSYEEVLNNPDPEDHYIPTHQLVMSHPWLAQNRQEPARTAQSAT